MNFFKNKEKSKIGSVFSYFKRFFCLSPKDHNGGGFSFFWKRMGKYFIKDFLRNKLISLTAISIIAVIVFAFNVVLIINLLAQKTIASINKQIDISVDISKTADEFMIQNLISELRKLPEVNKVQYISQEEALDSFKNIFPDSGLLDFMVKYNEPNPLPKSIAIKTHDINYNLGVIDYLRSSQYQNIIDLNRLDQNLDQMERINNLASITNFVYQGGVMVMLIFILISFLVIYNTIRITIYIHDQEIEIMKLVGARFNLIRFPFLIKGVLFSVTATIIAFLLIVLSYYRLEIIFVDFLKPFSQFSNFFNEINLIFYSSWSKILLMETIIVAFLGLFSSYLAVYSHLKKELQM